MSHENGYIKFNLSWVEQGPVIPAILLKSLNTWRDIMYGLEMVGANEEGIGFGNLSVRSGNTGKFYITGTATGRKTRRNAWNQLHPSTCADHSRLLGMLAK